LIVGCGDDAGDIPPGRYINACDFVEEPFLQDCHAVRESIG
jgi:hypothetical protein